MQTKVLPSPAHSVKLLADMAVKGKACRPGPVLWCLSHAGCRHAGS